jgi:hypothetical protein
MDPEMMSIVVLMIIVLGTVVLYAIEIIHASHLDLTRTEIPLRPTATLSHRLDPFLNYFDWRVAKGTAQCSSNTVYHLDGYLWHNLTAIRSYDGFGGHLIKVEQGAMDASDAAQTAVMEESGRAKKRPCVNYDDQIDRSKSFDMLNEVMDIAMDARLKSDLINDPLSLYCMRSVNKYFKKLAESIASEKIKTLNLSITPLVDGKEIYEEDKIYCYDSETCHVGFWDLEVGPSDFFVMIRRKRCFLSVGMMHTIPLIILHLHLVGIAVI